MRVTSALVALVALVVATGLLLGACGGSDDRGGAGPATPFGMAATTSAAAAKPPLRPARGTAITIGNEGEATRVAQGQAVQCDDNAVTIVGVTQVLTFTGECRSISLGAGANSLTVDRVKTLTLNGSLGSIIQVNAVDTITMDAGTISNTITAKSDLAGTGKPRCHDSGTGNQCP